MHGCSGLGATAILGEPGRVQASTTLDRSCPADCSVASVLSMTATTSTSASSSSPSSLQPPASELPSAPKTTRYRTTPPLHAPRGVTSAALAPTAAMQQGSVQHSSSVRLLTGSTPAPAVASLAASCCNPIRAHGAAPHSQPERAAHPVRCMRPASWAPGAPGVLGSGRPPAVVWDLAPAQPATGVTHHRPHKDGSADLCHVRAWSSTLIP